MKHTLQSKCLPSIEQFFDASGNLTPAYYRQVLGEIHTMTVKDFINSVFPKWVFS